MSAASVVSQLRSILEKSDHLIPKLERVYLTEEQWDTLRDMSANLVTAATTIQQRIRALEQSRADRAWKETEELRSYALASKGAVLAHGRLKHVFRRNIVTIFEGLKDSKFDTEDSRSRKAMTRQRCAQIRLLSPDGIISWAIAFAPSLWAGGSMATDIFKCLLDDVEPDCHLSWPSVVRETLYTLLEDEAALQCSTEYRELLKAYDTPSPSAAVPESNRKRKRLGDHYEPSSTMDINDRSPSDRQGSTTNQDESWSQRLSQNEQECHARLNPKPPNEENREMKHMYTNALASRIAELPQPLRGAIENSRLFRWERSQGLERTGCLTTVFPKDNTQDVTFTLWCGNVKGYHLISFFGLQHAMSS